MRRTAIKDIAAYCGFLLGFFGSAPFAWQQLATQVADGNFSRGLWYFLLFIFAAAVVVGTIGLGAGFLLGWAWERIHRRRRRRIGEAAAASEAQSTLLPDRNASASDEPLEAAPTADSEPRLRLVGSDRKPGNARGAGG